MDEKHCFLQEATTYFMKYYPIETNYCKQLQEFLSKGRIHDVHWYQLPDRKKELPDINIVQPSIFDNFIQINEMQFGNMSQDSPHTIEEMAWFTKSLYV